MTNAEHTNEVKEVNKNMIDSDSIEIEYHEPKPALPFGATVDSE